MSATEETRALQPITASNPIANLNDAFRQGRANGRLALTTGVIALGREALNDLLVQLRAFDAFTPDNDPYGEHDFGSLVWQGTTVFWKIDYYDIALAAGSRDPADDSITSRVMTIMLASEY